MLWSSLNTLQDITECWCKLNVYIVKYQIGFKTRNRKQQIYFVIVIGVTEI